MNENIYPREITKEDKAYLGIPIEQSLKKYFFSKLGHFKSVPGWLVSNGKAVPWKILGLTEENDIPYFYGPLQKGTLLKDILTSGYKKGIPALLKIVKAARVLANQEKCYPAIFTSSVMITSSGDVFFLPPNTMVEIGKYSKESVEMEQKELLNHPDLKDEKKTSYAVAASLYTILMGEPPFNEENEELLHNLIRNQKLVAPDLLKPELKQSVSSALLEGLKQFDYGPQTLEEWEKNLTLWNEEEIFVEISDRERQEKEKAAAEARAKMEKQYKSTRFWETQWQKVAVITTVAAMLLVFVGTSLFNLLIKQRETADLSPREVIESYFKGINEVDFSLVAECTMGEARNEEFEEVMNLHVILRQRNPVGYQTQFLSALKWEETGRPPIAPSYTLYGVCNVKMEKRQVSEEFLFDVEYEKWYSQWVENDYGSVIDVKYLGESRKETFHLKQDRGAWTIYQIDRLNTESLKYSPYEMEE